MVTPKLSIIVPVYNGEQYLDECLGSIVNQTLKEIEIIIVDDGSTDGTWEKCVQWADRDNRIIIIKKDNGGPQSAIYMGIRSARASIIGFVDADDWIGKIHFQTLYEKMITENADCVRGRVFQMLGDGRIELQKNKKNFRYGKEDIRLNILKVFFAENDTFLSIWTNARWDKLWKKGIVLEALESSDMGFAMGEDLIFNLQYLGKSECVVADSTIGEYYWRYNHHSLTHSCRIELFDDSSRFVSELERLARKYEYILKRDVTDKIWYSCAMSYGLSDMSLTYVDEYFRKAAIQISEDYISKLGSRIAKTSLILARYRMSVLGVFLLRIMKKIKKNG